MVSLKCIGKLSDVAKVISGYAFKSSEFGDQGIPVIKIKNVRKGFIDLSDAQYVKKDFLSLNEKYHVKSGDLLISLTGSHLTQPDSVVGRVAIQSKFADICLLNQRAGKIIIRDEQTCDKRFLYYTLFSEENSRNIALMAHGAASQANVSPTQVESLKVWLPDISIQHKIASILSAYDDLIDNNLKRIKILEEMAQMIYREWFVNFRFPGHEKVKMVDSPLGKIPQGWEIKKLGDIAEMNKQSIKKNNVPENILYVDISSVTTGSINEPTPYKFSDAPSRARRKVKHGDTIWSSVRPNRKSYALVIDPNPKTIISTGFGVISPISIPYTFLYEALTTDDFVGYLTNNARGAAYPAVNTEDYEKADILVPTDELMEQFHETMEHFYLLKNNLQTRNKNLRKTRDLLLPRLISGELDVEGLDINTDFSKGH